MYQAVSLDPARGAVEAGTRTDAANDMATTTTDPEPPAKARRPGGERKGAPASVEDLERALVSVARTILRLGVPPHALHEGERIDRSGYWMLNRLDESAGPQRLSDLAALLELDLSTVSRQAKQLVDGGLVTRVADPADGRACRLSVSERGRSVLEAVRAARHQVLRRALEGWSAAERGALTGALARLAADMQGVSGGSAA